MIRENNVAQLPALPVTMTLIDASHNHLGSTGIQNEAFKVGGKEKSLHKLFWLQCLLLIAHSMLLTSVVVGKAGL